VLPQLVDNFDYKKIFKYLADIFWWG